MNSLKNSTSNTLAAVKALAPDITFKADASFYWSPKTQAIAYQLEALGKPDGIWSLLHETSHALLKHNTYTSDFELLALEVAAWQHAKTLAKQLDVKIDENYVQDCLDTYRDWLHRRSTCPTCGSIGLQHTPAEYHCHNCHSTWHVSSARFCRPYRRKQKNTKEKSPDSPKNQTMFR